MIVEHILYRNGYIAGIAGMYGPGILEVDEETRKVISERPLPLPQEPPTEEQKQEQSNTTVEPLATVQPPTMIYSHGG